MCGAINERGCSFLASGAVEGKVREGENQMMLETITQYDIVLIKFKIQQNSMIRYSGIHMGIHVHVVTHT